MSRKVIRSDHAKADLKNHVRQIARHSPKAARGFLAMKDALDRLALARNGIALRIRESSCRGFAVLGDPRNASSRHH